MSAKPARKPSAYRYTGPNPVGFVTPAMIEVQFEGYAFFEPLGSLLRTDLRATAAFIGSSGAATLKDDQIKTGICMKVKDLQQKSATVSTPTTTVVPEPTVVAATSGSTSGKGSLEEIVEGIAKSTTLKVLEDYRPDPTMSKEQIEDLVSAKVAEIVKVPTVTNVTVNGVQVVTNSGEHRHRQYEEVLMHIVAEDTLYLWGGAGGGKTTMFRQIAKDLGRNFHFEECHAQFSVAKLTGFRDASGKVEETPFVKALKVPSIILIDEFDAAPGPVSVMFNALTANRMCSTPDGVVEMHPECVIVFSGNTPLDGATGAYNGRQAQDFSTKDRFSVVEFVYDEDMEEAITRSILQDDVKVKTWLRIVRAARTNVLSMGTSGDRIRVTPRAAYGGARMLAAGFSYEKTANARLRKGADQRTWDQVRAGIVEIGG